MELSLKKHTHKKIKFINPKPISKFAKSTIVYLANKTTIPKRIKAKILFGHGRVIKKNTMKMIFRMDVILDELHKMNNSDQFS